MDKVIGAAATVVALVAFVGLVAIPVVLLIRDLLSAFRPVGRGPDRAGGDSGSAGVPAPRKPVPPSRGGQAAAVP